MRDFASLCQVPSQAIHSSHSQLSKTRSRAEARKAQQGGHIILSSNLDIDVERSRGIED